MQAKASPVAASAPRLTCHVFRADELAVVAGVCLGDPLGSPADLCPGDVYALKPSARPHRLDLREAPDGRHIATAESEAAPEGAEAVREARLTFMAPDGSRAEILVLKVRPAREGARRWFLPLTPLEADLDYTLIEAERDPPELPLVDVTSVAFARRTRITLADGSQRPIEGLRPGDLVLTRDNGPQPLRHVLSRTVRAIGSFAPVVIARGAVGNASDLVVSQHLRLFLYRRGEDRLADRAETLVKAADLVDGAAVTLRKGGYCDYMSPVFDRHEVIYAECVPVESLLVNADTRCRMPQEDRAALDAMLPDLAQAPLRAAEAQAAALERARAELFRPRRR